jgi:hypothetical protein
MIIINITINFGRCLHHRPTSLLHQRSVIRVTPPRWNVCNTFNSIAEAFSRTTSFEFLFMLFICPWQIHNEISEIIVNY